MDYKFYSFQDVYLGTGATEYDAIVSALTQFADREIKDLSHAKEWCRLYVRMLVADRKSRIFSAVDNYSTVEIAEIMMEARDYAITGNTTPARYPIADALAQARSVTLVSILTSWRNSLATAFAAIADLSHKQTTAMTSIGNAASMVDLIQVMAHILENID